MKSKTYSLKNHGSVKLSANLLVSEFACHDGSDRILISSELVYVVQSIRDHFGVPVSIQSGYRSPAHNKKVGGVKDSQHLLGTAADIKVKGKTPEQVFHAINSGEVKGIDPNIMGVGLYPTFVHVDVRGNRARW